MCESVAILYKFAVNILGWGPFMGVDPTGKVIYQSKDEYMAAIKAFLTSGTQDQFEQFVLSFDKGSPNVEFNAPLSFVPSRGLVNKPNTPPSK